MGAVLKIVLLAAVLVVCRGVHAQIYRFTCFQHAAYEYVHTGDTAWVDTTYTIVLDFEKKKLNLRNKSSMSYNITNYQPLRTDKVGNTMICNAVDKYGNECHLELTMFFEISFHIATLVIRYPGNIYAYRLKRAR
jgi:hypothetical protein